MVLCHSRKRKCDCLFQVRKVVSIYWNVIIEEGSWKDGVIKCHSFVMCGKSFIFVRAEADFYLLWRCVFMKCAVVSFRFFFCAENDFQHLMDDHIRRRFSTRATQIKMPSGITSLSF